jgi:hypothetical protein
MFSHTNKRFRAHSQKYLLKYMTGKISYDFRIYVGKRVRLCTNTASEGYLEVLIYLRENNCDWDSWTLAYAALGGHMNIIKLLRGNDCKYRCDWSEWTCASAARNGHLEILKWSRANGCLWNEWTCAYATENKHLEVLKFAKNSGCPWFSETAIRAKKQWPNENFDGK